MADVKMDATIQEVLESDIFEYLELESLPEDDKAQMMENIIISLRSRMMLRIADILEAKSQEEFEKFKKLLSDESVTDTDVSSFLQANSINLDTIAAEEAIFLKAEVMGLKSKVKAGGENGKDA